MDELQLTSMNLFGFHSASELKGVVVNMFLTLFIASVFIHQLPPQHKYLRTLLLTDFAKNNKIKRDGWLRAWCMRATRFFFHRTSKGQDIYPTLIAQYDYQ